MASTTNGVLVRCETGARRVWALLNTLKAATWAAMDHDALNLAQATAFSAIFALFPALIVVGAVVALGPDFSPLRTQLAMFFDRVLPATVTPLLEVSFSKSSNAHLGWALLSTVAVSLSGATGVMATLMEGFRRAHKLPLLRNSFWPVRMRALVLVPLSLIPMAGASILVVFGHMLTVWVAHQLPTALQVPFYVGAFLVRWTVALMGSVGILAVIYHLGTDLTRGMKESLEPLMKDFREPMRMLRSDWSWRSSLPGAVVATVLWFFSTILFGVYVTRFANYSRVYGSLGAGMALLFWLDLIALSVLIGAEFNAQRTVHRRDPQLTEALWKLPSRPRPRTGRITN